MDGSIPEIAAELAPEAPVPAPEPVKAAPVERAKPEPVEVNTAVQAEVQEVDLSDEWATLLDASRPAEGAVEAPAPVPPKPAPGARRHPKPGDMAELQTG